jgi:hypothetical protein
MMGNFLHIILKNHILFDLCLMLMLDIFEEGRIIFDRNVIVIILLLHRVVNMDIFHIIDLSI